MQDILPCVRQKNTPTYHMQLAACIMFSSKHDQSAVFNLTQKQTLGKASPPAVQQKNTPTYHAQFAVSCSSQNIIRPVSLLSESSTTTFGDEIYRSKKKTCLYTTCNSLCLSYRAMIHTSKTPSMRCVQSDLKKSFGEASHPAVQKKNTPTHHTKPAAQCSSQNTIYYPVSPIPDPKKKVTSGGAGLSCRTEEYIMPCISHYINYTSSSPQNTIN